MQALPITENQPSQRPKFTVIEGGKPFRDAIAECVPELLARALKLTRTRSAADDLTQDTVERALRFEANFSKGTNLRAWLYSVMFSVFITRCRRTKRERHYAALLALDPCAWTTPEMACDARHVSEALQRAIAQLNPDFRDALLLVDLADMPYRDAALELGVPVGTVMSRLHRARRTLRDAITATDRSLSMPRAADSF